MSIDITPLVRMVKRLDISANFKAFVVVGALLMTIPNLRAIFMGIVESPVLVDMESNDTLFAIGYLLTAFVVFLVPLSAILWDWLARKPWRHLDVIAGAFMGALAFGLIGAAFGTIGFLILEEFDPAAWTDRIAYGVLLVSLLVAVTAWLLAQARWSRWVSGSALVILLIVGPFVVVLFGYVLPGEEGDGIHFSDLFNLVLLVVTLLAAAWFFRRAIYHRIILSTDLPKDLLLGALTRKGFWVRLAFLTGLPSTLWRREALKSPAFWAFVLARPLVYVGVVVLLSDSNVENGTAFTVSVGIGLFVVGHVLFWAGKRLAARQIWSLEYSSDQGAPILFLRSFQDDQMSFKRPWWQIPGHWFDLWSFRRNADEAIIDEVAQYGPVVALGIPGEKKVPFGAMRYYSSHDDWKETIAQTARSAQTILISAACTPSVKWEYQLMAREGLLERVLLLFPPPTEKVGQEEDTLAVFAESTGLNDIGPVSGDLQSIALLQTESGPALLQADRSSAAAYIVALRAHFQRVPARDLASPLVQ
jgi:MFS family permease